MMAVAAGAVPYASLFRFAFLLPVALLDLGETIGGGIKLAQVTGAVLVVTEALLPLLLLVTFGQVGEVGSLCGLETRDPVFAFLFLPVQEGIRRFFAFACIGGRLLRIEFFFDRVDQAGDAAFRPIGFAEEALPCGLLQGVEVAELLPGFFFKDMGGLFVFGFLP
jgi:hypothetical protein